MKPLVALTILGLALRLTLAAAWYTDDFRAFESGDYALYRIGAEHVQAEGNLNNSLFLARPPVFPLVVLALGLDSGRVLLTSIVFGALIVPLTYGLARQLGLRRRSALMAASIVAVDPASLVFSAFLGSEPLANLLVVLSLLLFVTILRSGTFSTGWVWGVGAGAALALSALTRPAAYLLWIPLGVLGLWLQPRRWPALLVFAATCAAGIGGWILYNGAVFNHPTFSTVGPYTMLYYHAASVERLATGNDIDAVYVTLNQRVEARLGRETTSIYADLRYNYHAPTPDVEAALSAVAVDIFRTYPLLTLVTFPIGFVRMFGLLPSVSPYDGLFASLDAAWNGLFFTGALLGLRIAIRRRYRTMVWLGLLVSAYFIGGILLVKTSGLDTRERSMLTPLMAISGALFLQTLCRRYERRQRRLRLRSAGGMTP